MRDESHGELALEAVWRAEEALLRSDFRHDIDALERHLDSDFHEIGQSGQHWSREETIEALAAEAAGDIDFDIDERRVDRLEPALVLLTYRLNYGGRVSRRSSLWRLGAECPTLLFHQGTSAQ